MKSKSIFATSCCLWRIGGMPRYKYITPFWNWYKYDCNWWPQTWDLKEARANAEAKHPEATIGVHAECLIQGKSAVAKVLVYVKDTIGKTDPEVIEMLDKEIDQFIEIRKGDTWRPGGRL